MRSLLATLAILAIIGVALLLDYPSNSPATNLPASSPTSKTPAATSSVATRTEREDHNSPPPNNQENRHPISYISLADFRRQHPDLPAFERFYEWREQMLSTEHGRREFLKHLTIDNHNLPSPKEFLETNVEGEPSARLLQRLTDLRLEHDRYVKQLSANAAKLQARAIVGALRQGRSMRIRFGTSFENSDLQLLESRFGSLGRDMHFTCGEREADGSATAYAITRTHDAHYFEVQDAIDDAGKKLLADYKRAIKGR